MKKEIADKWCEALRSGEYIQGQKKLNYNGQFCCIGVLCELALKDGVKLSVLKKEDTVVQYDRDGAAAPLQVKEWSGLQSMFGNLKLHENTSLASLNDNGYTFNQIADIIEKHYEEL